MTATVSLIFGFMSWTSADCMVHLYWLVRVSDLREVQWCGFLAPAVWTGANFCYGLVPLVNFNAILCNLGMSPVHLLFWGAPIFHHTKTSEKCTITGISAPFFFTESA